MELLIEEARISVSYEIPIRVDSKLFRVAINHIPLYKVIQSVVICPKVEEIKNKRHNY